jgi:hypothetical protein
MRCMREWRIGTIVLGVGRRHMASVLRLVCDFFERLPVGKSNRR